MQCSWVLGQQVAVKSSKVVCKPWRQSAEEERKWVKGGLDKSIVIPPLIPNLFTFTVSPSPQTRRCFRIPGKCSACSATSGALVPWKKDPRSMPVCVLKRAQGGGNDRAALWRFSASDFKQLSTHAEMCQSLIIMQQNKLKVVFCAIMQPSNFDPSGFSPADLCPICFIVCFAKAFEDLSGL